MHRVNLVVFLVYDRESDSSQFSCHFDLGSFEKDGRFALRTKAIIAPQEVVRC